MDPTPLCGNSDSPTGIDRDDCTYFQGINLTFQVQRDLNKAVTIHR